MPVSLDGRSTNAATPTVAPDASPKEAPAATTPQAQLVARLTALDDEAFAATTRAMSRDERVTYLYTKYRAVFEKWDNGAGLLGRAGDGTINAAELASQGGVGKLITELQAAVTERRDLDLIASLDLVAPTYDRLRLKAMLGVKRSPSLESGLKKPETK